MASVDDHNGRNSATRSRCVRCWLVLLVLVVLSLCSTTCHSLETTNEDDADDDHYDALKQQVHRAKMDLWSRGAWSTNLPSSTMAEYGDTSTLQQLMQEVVWMADEVAMAPIKLGPVKRSTSDGRQRTSSPMDRVLFGIRGGGGDTTTDNHVDIETRIQELGATLGSDFLDAIAQNKRDHEEDCRKSCEMYFCALPNDSATTDGSKSDGSPAVLSSNETRIRSYNFGNVPPEDFSFDFGFPLDLIKVTEGEALFDAQEAAQVIATAEAEGVAHNEYKSGKYQLGGDWLTNLPQTRAWFNEKLEHALFPLLTYLFPEIVTGQHTLRAHSVSLLKYNVSHPRTDVHIDNGILAMTLAMTPTAEYSGGGTFFEHFDDILEMDVGHGTFRPGSVRHGGNRVTAGTRYILGAFLLLEDRVEHVRRLKNKGAELRQQQAWDAAIQYFSWALAINPQCTTCLKDWAEILHQQGNYVEAEQKLRAAMELLEYKDSDALFTLGLLLSEQGRHDESVAAYRQSVELNAEDAELLYNLGIKLGSMGNIKEERTMYARAVQVDPKFGGAWLNWGTSLAEAGELDDAEIMFRKAVQCDGEVVPKAMINLGLVQHTRANRLAQSGKLVEAETAAQESAKLLDQARPMLERLVQDSKTNDAKTDAQRYLAQYRPLRLQAHRMVGQLYAGKGDMDACEEEFREALKNFPQEPLAFQLLHRVLEMRGKSSEAAAIKAQFEALKK